MLTLFHDVTDPASAVAVARCTRLAAEGVPIAFEGFEAVGLDVALPPDITVLARLADLVPIAAAEGVVLRRPRSMPPTGLAHVLLGHAEGATTDAGGDGEAREVAAAVRLGVYRAHWSEDRDVADPSVLLDIAVGAGLDVAEVAAILEDRVALAARRRRMTSFRRDGVGGVPVVLASRTLVPGLLEEEQIRDLAAVV